MTTTSPTTSTDPGVPDPALVGTRPGASATDPVTGPLPVLTMVDGHLEISVRRGVTILSLDGALDDGLAELVVEPLRRAVASTDLEAVALDLDRVTLLDRTGLDAVLHALDHAPADAPCCLVAGRLSGRLVLERWNVTDRYVVFTSVADALQARAFADSGYGTGWDLPA